MASIKVSGIFTLAKSGRVQMQLTALRGVFIIGPPPEPRLLRRLNREWEDPPMIGYTGPIQCLRFHRSITLPRPCYPSPHLYFIALCTLVRPANRKIRIFGEIEKFRAILPLPLFLYSNIRRNRRVLDNRTGWNYDWRNNHGEMMGNKRMERIEIIDRWFLTIIKILWEGIKMNIFKYIFFWNENISWIWNLEYE